VAITQLEFANSDSYFVDHVSKIRLHHSTRWIYEYFGLERESYKQTPNESRLKRMEGRDPI
jgi:hypothetical protein